RLGGGLPEADAGLRDTESFGVRGRFDIVCAYRSDVVEISEDRRADVANRDRNARKPVGVIEWPQSATTVVAGRWLTTVVAVSLTPSEFATACGARACARPFGCNGRRARRLFDRRERAGARRCPPRVPATMRAARARDRT